MKIKMLKSIERKGRICIACGKPAKYVFKNKAICNECYGKMLTLGKFQSTSYHISDTHFYHDKIIKYCNRPFTNVEDMNGYIIKQWNSMIGKNDIIYHHGDFALNCDKDMVKKLVSQLNGKIILITGNHDKRSNGWFLDCGFIEVYNKPVQMGSYILSHQPVVNLPIGYKNIHGHIHNYDRGLNSNYINVSCEVLNYRPIWIKFDIRKDDVNE